ncbi:fimbrial biogenesis outer membrane usher protein, partial [Vibrio parahaemolyticus]|nr:fimbrial biogenesis outer membrane usher protein [Vibrio parahaemolyticus]
MNAFFWLVLLSVTWSSIGLCANSANHFSELPSPENFSLEKFENISLNLELVINQRATGLVAKVERVGDQFFLLREDLISVGVTAKSLPGTEERLEVTSIPGVNVRYLQSSLQLAIDVPPNWLPMQNLSAQDMGRFSPAQFGRGGLLNYNVFGVYENESRQKEVSINHEVRAFSEFGVFSTTGIFKSNFHRDVQSQ